MTEGMHLIEVVYSGFFKLEKWHVPGSPHPHMVLRTTDSVVGLLRDRTNRRVLFIAQNRPAMVREDNPEGRIVECIAGRFDVNLGPKALLVKEALEEGGVVITESDVQLLNNGVPVALTAGACTERSHLTYAEITPEALTGTDDEIRGADGEGEAIGRVWVNIDDLDNTTFDDARAMALVRHLQLQLALERIQTLTTAYTKDVNFWKDRAFGFIKKEDVEED